MRYIRRKSSIKLDETTGNIVDTLNVEDKVRNAPSINLLQQMSGVPTEGIIAYETEDGIIPEGYEEVNDPITVYSTTEQIIGTWIDGKPIYRVVIDLGLIPSTTLTTIYHLICDIDILIDCKGKMINATSRTCSLLPANTSGITGAINTYSLYSSYIIVELIRSNVGAWTDRNFVVTVEYTKSTD